jgi:hypothetical protein
MTLSGSSLLIALEPQMIVVEDNWNLSLGYEVADGQ